jgi:MFS family permease
VVFILLASLDNAAGALIPTLIRVMSQDLGTSEGTLGIVTAALILVTAITAVAWGYWGDRSSRKRLLLWGTLIWAVGLAASGASRSVSQLFVFSVITGVGLGSITSVGFSVVSDFISPARRGLAMSFWGLSQGIGGLVGLLMGGLLGGTNWRIPFFVIAGAGIVAALAYLGTFDTERGRSEPALEDLFVDGGSYEWEIEAADVPMLIRRPTNRWLILQGFTAQIAYGSLVWVPLLYQAKVSDEGYSLAVATTVGSLFGALFQLGGLTSILAGHIGDRMQRRNRRARALISAIGITGAIPFFLAFFFVPLRGLDIPTDEGTMAIVLATLQAVVTNPWVAASFFLSIGALSFTGADSPNWFALITDVNLPEHRGTVFGIGNLVNGFGRSIGNGLTGLAANALARSFAQPWNFAVGLALFQVFFLPTGYCYWRASKVCEADMDEVQDILRSRAGD